MRLYRRLQPIKAISFDLDDTLYSNHPVMLAANRVMLSYFSTNPALQTLQAVKNADNKHLDHKFWFYYRTLALKQQPELVHDISALRIESYYLGFLALNLPAADAREQALLAMRQFNVVRSDITVPESVHALLAALANQFPLVAISNGNVNTQSIGIESYFDAIYHAGKNLRQKPDVDMFALACQKLSIHPGELLHVGDCGRADVFGAISAGCQSAWLPYYNVGKPLTVLPDIELNTLDELRYLLS